MRRRIPLRARTVSSGSIFTTGPSEFPLVFSEISREAFKGRVSAETRENDDTAYRHLINRLVRRFNALINPCRSRATPSAGVSRGVGMRRSFGPARARVVVRASDARERRIQDPETAFP